MQKIAVSGALLSLDENPGKQPRRRKKTQRCERAEACRIDQRPRAADGGQHPAEGEQQNRGNRGRVPGGEPGSRLPQNGSRGGQQHKCGGRGRAAQIGEGEQQQPRQRPLKQAAASASRAVFAAPGRTVSNISKAAASSGTNSPPKTARNRKREENTAKSRGRRSRADSGGGKLPALSTVTVSGDVFPGAKPDGPPGVCVSNSRVNMGASASKSAPKTSSSATGRRKEPSVS